MDLPLVGSIPTCPKCGLPCLEGGVRTIYHPRVPLSGLIELVPCLTMMHGMHQEVGEECLDSAEIIGEHICRICTRCQYGWVERTADTEAKEDDDAGVRTDTCSSED